MFIDKIKAGEPLTITDPEYDNIFNEFKML
ncbi:hypothetical protein ACVPOQ_09045 [Staphylococcus aureus]